MSKENIINTYDQTCAAGGDRIVIYHQTQETGRSYRSASWKVARYHDGQEILTDPKGAWYEYGKKTFSLSSLQQNEGESLRNFRNRILQDAINWANKKYGAREFVKNRLGDYVEKEVNEKFPIPPRSRLAPEQVTEKPASAQDQK